VNVADKNLTGRIAAENIRMMQVPRPPDGMVARFLALGDPTGIISDTMDELGIPSGIVGASVLRPTITGKTMVGPALTLRNIHQRIEPLAGARGKVNKMAEHECHNLAQPGDVLVIQGVPNVSNLGGMSAQVGKRQGEVGAIVEGGVRDIGHSRGIGFPIWSTDISPATGKWRLEAAEINGPVVICGVKVSPGDLVVADDTGVCFIPRERIVEVLEGAEKKSKAEEIRCKEIDGGMPVVEIVRPAPEK
jgi:4-hydroxy-4-methyl-2-oxoglutarate aldolase